MRRWRDPSKLMMLTPVAWRMRWDEVVPEMRSCGMTVQLAYFPHSKYHTAIWCIIYATLANKMKQYSERIVQNMTCSLKENVWFYNDLIIMYPACYVGQTWNSINHNLRPWFCFSMPAYGQFALKTHILVLLFGIEISPLPTIREVDLHPCYNADKFHMVSSLVKSSYKVTRLGTMWRQIHRAGPVFAKTRRPIGHRRLLALMSDVGLQYRRTQWPT